MRVGEFQFGFATKESIFFGKEFLFQGWMDSLEGRPLAGETQPEMGDLQHLQDLVVRTQSQLAQAMQDARSLDPPPDLGAGSESEEDDPLKSGTGNAREELNPTLLNALTPSERQAAIKRSKNREAARRSRRRRTERLQQLRREVHTLQQQNLLLLKCIEEFAQKNIASKEQQAALLQQLSALHQYQQHAGPQEDLGQQHLCDAPGIFIPQDLDVLPASHEAPAASFTQAAGTLDYTQPPPDLIFPDPAYNQRGINVAGVILPALEDLELLPTFDLSQQLTARSNEPMSARAAAIGEHIAMLSSKENTPRDEEDEGGAEGNDVKQSEMVTQTCVPVPRLPCQQHQTLLVPLQEEMFDQSSMPELRNRADDSEKRFTT